MKRGTFFWILAFVITLASAYYQRVTGPTYPVSGRASLNGAAVTYKLDRSYGGEGDAPVTIQTGKSTVQGLLEWKRFKTGDEWRSDTMRYADGVLAGRLPHQPPAGKLQYRVVLTEGAARHTIPDENGTVIRFKGDVPTWILIIHVIAMFGAMLLSTRTGFETLQREPRLREYTYWTIGFLAVGGLILGPIVQKYAFGAFWTGWPFGTDLTDNKTFVALLGWVVAAVMLRKATARRWVVAAAVLLFVVYLIPHSVLGSEIDYSKTEQKVVGNGLPH